MLHRAPLDRTRLLQKQLVQDITAHFGCGLHIRKCLLCRFLNTLQISRVLFPHQSGQSSVVEGFWSFLRCVVHGLRFRLHFRFTCGLRLRFLRLLLTEVDFRGSSGASSATFFSTTSSAGSGSGTLYVGRTISAGFFSTDATGFGGRCADASSSPLFQ